MSDKFDYKAFDEGRADQLLRETMEGHRIEPNPDLWKGISRKLLWKELIHFNLTNVSPKYWMVGIAGLLLVATTLYVGIPGIFSDKSSIEPSGKFIPVTINSANPVALPHPDLLANSHQKSLESGVVTNPDVRSFSGNKSSKSAFTTEPPPLAPVPDMAKISNQTFFAESVSLPIELSGENMPPAHAIGLTAPTGITRISPFGTALFDLSPGADTIITITNANGTVKFRKSVPGASRFFSANLGITPEIACYAEPVVYSKMNFWLDGRLTYHISRFSVATGFGLGYVFDEGAYRVEYKSLDSVGYFNSVTSYSVGNNNEIIYNTQSVSVYDSLQHLNDYRTKNRYSYLQVPLLVGYRFFESSRVSLTFQVGPAVSFLLATHKSDPVIEYSNATIIRVDNETPTRIQTNWQIWANLYFEMRINKIASIYLEPTFKYYLKPLVSQENVKYKAPWTIGMGVGLQLNFGQKTKSP